MARQASDKFISIVQSPADRRLLIVIKSLLALILIGLLLAGKEDRAWPLVTWPMFSDLGQAPPDAQTSRLTLRFVDSGGQTYTLAPENLYDLLPPPAAIQSVSRTFSEQNPAKRRDGFGKLAAQARAVLPDVDIVEIQAWELRWQVDSRKSPAFDRARPDEEILLGSFRLADVEGPP